MADLISEDENTYTVKGPGGKAVKVPKSTANAVGFKPPPRTDASGFIGYVRDFPAKTNQTVLSEVNRLYKDPKVGEWFQQHKPDATPQERANMIHQQAMQNATQLAQHDFNAARQKYGVTKFTQDDFRNMLDGENMKAPSGEGNATARQLAGKNYDSDLADIHKQASANEFQRLQGYLPFDQPTPPPQPMMPTRPPPQARPMAPPPTTPAAVNMPAASFDGAPPAPGPQGAPAPSPALAGGPPGGQRMYQPGTEAD